jgi:bacillithiol system protein YtxJ
MSYFCAGREQLSPSGRSVMISPAQLKFMNPPFVEIVTVDALDQFLTRANGSPAVLFKHSTTCGVSARAYAEMSKLREPVGLITVQKARAVSDEIEKRWQVDHQSPQVLIIRDGKAVWDASHFQVKAEKVESALETA